MEVLHKKCKLKEAEKSARSKFTAPLKCGVKKLTNKQKRTVTRIAF